MRLLSEYMSVPETNVAVICDELAVGASPALPALNEGAETKGADAGENRNLQIARCIEEEKTKLIRALSCFPISAQWVLAKYGQNIDNGSDENLAPPSELAVLLDPIKNHYRAITPGADQKPNRAAYPSYPSLMAAVQAFPFTFEDLVKLVDILAYAFKFRGLAFQANQFHEKKQYDIASKRLNRLTIRNQPESAEHFKLMDLHQHEEQFLFLAPNEMAARLAEVILAEHQWLAFRQELATANAKLVLFIANQYKGSFLDFDDLVQEGHSGLLKAVDRFKYRMGFQFSTYAGYWIRQAISRALSRSERVVRIPCGQVALINKVYRAKEELMLKTGTEPSVAKIAEYTQISQNDINDILTISQTSIALETFADDDSEQAFAPIDFLEQDVFGHSFNQIAQDQLKALVDLAVKTLNPREAKIVCSHFGIGTDNPMTLQEIGSDMKLTRERVRQIQAVALDKIKRRYGEQLSGCL
jgi:RNA polymerase sigma factor (sigma-70 family)